MAPHTFDELFQIYFSSSFQLALVLILLAGGELFTGNTVWFSSFADVRAFFACVLLLVCARLHVCMYFVRACVRVRTCVFVMLDVIHPSLVMRDCVYSLTLYYSDTFFLLLTYTHMCAPIYYFFT